jgi:hypothetical protein
MLSVAQLNDDASPGRNRASRGRRSPGLRLTCVLLAVLAPLSLARADAPWANEFISRWEAASRAIGAAPDAGHAAQRCAELIREAVDTEALTEEVAVAFQADARQRKGLESAIPQRLVSDCVRRRRDYADATLALLGVRDAGRELFITASVTRKDRPAERLVWRTRSPAAERPRALDVIMGGRSMSAGVKDSLATLLRSRGGDLDRAIKALGGGA